MYLQKKDRAVFTDDILPRTFESMEEALQSNRPHQRGYIVGDKVDISLCNPRLIPIVQLTYADLGWFYLLEFVLLPVPEYAAHFKKWPLLQLHYGQIGSRPVVSAWVKQRK
jgi:hypothetical protein